MPQIFQVLRCFKCMVFQVHQTKKSNKFSCKMCGEKQSIKRHYGVGTGQECRLQVQKLNGLRGELDELDEVLQSNNDSEEELNEAAPTKITISKDKSKWKNFIDEDNEMSDPESTEPMYLGNAEVVLEVPKRNKRFVKPKPTNKSNEIQSHYQTDKKRHWPLQNKIAKTYPCSEMSKIETVKTTEVLNSQKENIINLKYKLSEENIIHDLPKPKIKKVFEHLKVNKQSKWAQFTENDDEVNKSNDGENYINEQEEDEIKHEFCLSTNDKLNEISRREEYFQESEKSPAMSQLGNTNEHEVKTNIFSTYDESELDSILDI